MTLVAQASRASAIVVSVLGLALLGFGLSESVEPASRMMIAYGAAVGVGLRWYKGRGAGDQAIFWPFVGAALAGAFATAVLMGSEHKPEGVSLAGDFLDMIAACLWESWVPALVVASALAAMRHAKPAASFRCAALAFGIAVVTIPLTARPVFESGPTGADGRGEASRLLRKLREAQALYYKEHQAHATTVEQLGPAVAQKSWRSGMRYYSGTITILSADSTGWRAAAWVATGNWTCTAQVRRVSDDEDAEYDDKEPACTRDRRWFASYDHPPRLTLTVLPGPYYEGETLSLTVSASPASNADKRLEGEVLAVSTDPAVAQVTPRPVLGALGYEGRVQALHAGYARVRVTFRTSLATLVDSFPAEVLENPARPSAKWEQVGTEYWLDTARVTRGADGTFDFFQKTREPVSRFDDGARHNEQIMELQVRCAPLAYRQMTFGYALNDVPLEPRAARAGGPPARRDDPFTQLSPSTQMGERFMHMCRLFGAGR